MRKKILKISILLIFIITYIFFLTYLTYINIYNKSNHDSIKQTNIPKLYFSGDIKNMLKKEDRRMVKVTYESTNVNFEKYAEINIHGTSSATFDKKSYTMRLYTSKNKKKKYKVDLGWGEHNDYALKANWIDKSHARNIVTARIIGQMQKKYNVLNNLPNNGMTDGFPIEIYDNENFLGLYTLNIPKADWMFDIDKDDKNNILLNSKKWSESTKLKEKINYKDWEIELGPKTNETTDKFNKLIYFLNEATNEEIKKDLDKYIDISSAINFYIAIDLFYLTDNVGKNILMLTYDGKKWYPLAYDLDGSFGMRYSGLETYDYFNDFNQSTNKLFERLEENFSNEIADRYFEMRKDIITENNLIKEVRKFENEIPKSSFLKEENKWKEIPGFGIDQIEDFIKTRIDVVDKIMNNLYKDNNVNKNPTKKLV